jgi:hypothetical protein
MEIDKLRSLQCQVPAGFTVVTGPRNSGKTALLKDVFAHQADAVYVDCRTLDRGNPASLTKALLAELAAKAPASAVQQAAEVCGKFAAVAADMEMQVKWDGSSYTTSEIAQAFLTFQAHQQDLGDVFKALGWVQNGCSVCNIAWVVPDLTALTAPLGASGFVIAARPAAFVDMCCSWCSG